MTKIVITQCVEPFKGWKAEEYQVTESGETLVQTTTLRDEDWSFFERMQNLMSPTVVGVRMRLA